ncbi:hypothetical protein HL42_2927 [Trichophyton rubrum]|nr:hypothetical protein HL42_2927 [Trichophyton rubrum]
MAQNGSGYIQPTLDEMSSDSQGEGLTGTYGLDIKSGILRWQKIYNKRKRQNQNEYIHPIEYYHVYTLVQTLI